MCRCCRNIELSKIDRDIARKFSGINKRIVYGLGMPKHENSPEFERLWKEWVKAVREDNDEKRKEVIKKISELPN